MKINLNVIKHNEILSYQVAYTHDDTNEAIYDVKIFDSRKEAEEFINKLRMEKQ